MGKQFGKSHNEAKKANKCISDSLSNKFANPGIFNTDRDYKEVVTPTIFNPPPISAGDGITQDQANALNSLAQTAADLLSLNLAIGSTAQRMNWAAQAAGIAGSDLSSSSAVVERAMLNANNDLYYLDLQFQAYRDFINQYADKLDEYADEIDTLLLAQEGEDETYFLPEDFQSTRNELANNGFDDEERSYHEQTGLSADLIVELEQDLVAAYDRYPAEPISFSELLISIQDDMQDLAAELRGKYPSPEGVQQLSASQEPGIYVEPQVYTFEVGHPFSGQATVELVVRPVSIPLGWTYELSGNSFSLGEGETVEASLTLYPDGNALERDLIQVTVEGTVNGELVGGILTQYHAPSLTPSISYGLNLPTVVK